jgi:6-pyruvoyltetrahydropterin/6-carboxytetrahydropterin synthase
MKQVTKTYGHEQGLSATFRQWRAKSHCRFIHGYALSFAFLFECPDDEVDENGWVINFGGLKPLKQWLCDTFDHKTLVAKDDPYLMLYREWADAGLIQLIEVERTGCEAFAELAACQAQYFLSEGMFGDTKAKLVMVECREHAGNGATHIVNNAITVANMNLNMQWNPAEYQRLVREITAEVNKRHEELERRLNERR